MHLIEGGLQPTGVVIVLHRLPVPAPVAGDIGRIGQDKIHGLFIESTHQLYAIAMQNDVTACRVVPSLTNPTGFLFRAKGNLVCAGHFHLLYLQESARFLGTPSGEDGRDRENADGRGRVVREAGATR